MLAWPTRSAKRDTCRYGCCLRFKKRGQASTKANRQREKRVWKKDSP